MRPGPFLKTFLFALRALFSLGLRPGLFRPSGILPPAGNFLLAQKVPQKRLPPVALRGLGLTRNPLGAFLLRTHQRGSRGVVQNLEGVSTALCIQPRVFDTRLSNSPYANFTLLHVNSRVDRKQGKVDTSTALYSRLLKAGGWLQKLLLTRSKFCTTPRDPR